LVVCADYPGAAALAERSAALGVRVVRYGSGSAVGLTGRLIDWEQQGTGAVALIQIAGETRPRTMRLAVPGRHMALNALAAVLAAVEGGAPVEDVLDGIAGFEGVRRRFELIGTADGVRVFDDYAHHPTEVRAVLTALHTIAHQDPTGRPTITGARSIVVFQPHLYSRTKTFAREFALALDGADEVFVLDVYAAREQPLAGISGATIAEHVGVPVHYVPDFSAVAEKVAATVKPGDVVVTMGAGDVTLLAPEIISALRAKADSRSLP
jgi:UDP-N-acetylmuramate--alanine ligase